MDPEFWIFLGVGFLAQLVDGALGMAYGVISSTVLLAFGVPPATASATVHAAEMATTGVSGAAHVWRRNVDWRLLGLIAVPGMIGGAAGAWLLTSIDPTAIRPFVTAWLAAMGLLILWKARGGAPPAQSRPIGWRAAPLGLFGGFLDASGGGGWGPVVTSTLMAGSDTPRKVIGTVNTAEFAVTVAISSAFLAALLTGHWAQGKTVADHAWAVAGLIVGGVLAAPLAAFVVQIMPRLILMRLVGGVVLALAGFQTLKLLGWV